MSKINKIKLSGTTYDVEDANASKTVELTQAQYDALVQAGTVDPNTFYIITDGETFDPSSKADTSAFTAHTGDSTIHVTSSEKSTWNAKSDFSGSYNDLTNKPTIPSKTSDLTNDSNFATSGYVDSAVSGKANSSDVYTKSETSGATEIATALNAKLDSTAYTPTDLSNYYQKSETSGATQISNALANKLDSTAYTPTDLSNYYQKSETSGATQISDALSGKQDTLSAGTNITIVDNVISAEGGGKAIVAGTGIAITTGETANTVSLDINAKKGSSNTALVFNYTNSNTATAAGATSFGYMCKATNQYTFANGNNTQAKGYYSHSEGETTIANGWASHSDGQYTNANGKASHTEGSYVNAENDYESSQGRYNVSNKANTTWGNSGNTLFSVGNGTANNARHNAFEIRQNGDIYISLNGQDVKLQDQLGGGGGGITSGEVQTMIDESVSGKADTSAVTESITEATSGKVNISDNNVSAFSDYKVALESGKNYTSDNISTFYLGINKTSNNTSDLVTITTTDTNYPTIIINCTYSNGNILTVNTNSGITSSVENGVAQITLTGGTLATVVSASSGGVVFLYKQYVSGQTADVVEDTVYDALKELSNNKLDYIYKDEIINSQKTFLWGSSNDKPIIFKQTNNGAKIGFQCKNSASTNNEIATFEFRPDTYTDSSSASHPLLYIGHYRNTNTANAGVPQTVVGFRQYDQSGGAAYHLFAPLPEEAKTPFSLTTSFQNYFIPLGFKNGSTMIKTDNTGVADFSDVLGGLKLVKLTQTEYDNLGTKDSNTLYVITTS